MAHLPLFTNIFDFSQHLFCTPPFVLSSSPTLVPSPMIQAIDARMLSASRCEASNGTLFLWSFFFESNHSCSRTQQPQLKRRTRTHDPLSKYHHFPILATFVHASADCLAALTQWNHHCDSLAKNKKSSRRVAPTQTNKVSDESQNWMIHGANGMRTASRDFTEFPGWNTHRAYGFSNVANGSDACLCMSRTKHVWYPT